MPKPALRMKVPESGRRWRRRGCRERDWPVESWPHGAGTNFGPGLRRQRGRSSKKGKEHQKTQVGAEQVKEEWKTQSAWGGDLVTRMNLKDAGERED